MPKKRRSGGRSKGRKGRSGAVQCGKCGALIPRDKAKKVTRYISLVDSALAHEMRRKGTFLPRQRVESYYCISCAVHSRVVKVRAKEERSRRY